ncbi:MAG: ribonuclease HII [bacterium]
MKKTSKTPQYIVGIDEVGRGPLAGPVTLCAVVCSAEFYKKLARYEGLTDSKKLTEKNREHWYTLAKLMKAEGLISFVVVSKSNTHIDRYGISASIKTAVVACLEKLEIDPLHTKVLLDGSLHAPAIYINQETIIKGDQKEKIISLASIIAKVTRDRYMVKIAKKYPVYGFDIHKGYGTKIHRDAIKKHGMSDLHRKSFCGKI